MTTRLHRRRPGALAMIGCCLALSCIAGAAEAAVCLMEVVSQPEGAEIFVDNESRGIAPVTVSVGPGKHLLAAEKDGYVETRKTVAVGDNTETLQVTMQLERIFGLLLIHSQPSGATVVIDGADRGKTPMLLTDLPRGNYRVAFQKTRYLPMEKVIDIVGRIPQKLNVVLRSDSATLRVTSVPVGATVLIGGIDRGTTPCTIDEVPPGKNEISLRLDGYKLHKQLVTLRSGEEIDLNANLEPKPGSIMIHSVPDKATVYVNGERRGNAPLAIEDLAPGTYRIRVELAGYLPLLRNVEVVQGASAAEEFRLERNSGLLELITQPAGAQVFIDGTDIGTTTVAEGESDAISEPLIIDTLEPGAHTVQLSKKGYESETIIVSIQKDRTATISQKLKRMFIPDTIVRTGSGPNETYIGVLKLTFDNGDIQMELRPGVFRLFKKWEVKSVEPYVLDKPPED